MRKFILLFNFIFAACYTINIYADRKAVDLTSDHRPGGSQGHPCAHPTVTYDDDEITIKSDSIIQDLNVVIRDQYGEVLHSSTVTASQDGTFIYVPKYGDSEKTTIDLYYDRKHLSRRIFLLKMHLMTEIYTITSPFIRKMFTLETKK